MNAEVQDVIEPLPINPNDNVKEVSVYDDEDKENFALTQGTNAGTNTDQAIAILRREQELALLAAREAMDRNRLREKTLDLLKKMTEKKS